jgi:uncharacterized protein YdeI (YjbR/CyaY-like superfamily)
MAAMAQRKSVTAGTAKAGAAKAGSLKAGSGVAAAKKTAAKKAAAKKSVAKAASEAPSSDPRIDAYIAKSAPFARPILEYLRSVVHTACPAVEESIKWGMPSFVYRGKLMCGMAAFKQHATFGFWQGANIVGAEQSAGSDAMGQFGRLSALADLPGKRELGALVKQAMALIESGAKRPPTKTAQAKPPVQAPADLKAALGKNAKARATFAAFPPSQQREYVEWIESAKREATRTSRLAQAVEWMAEGKVRNWKYMEK